MSTSTSRKLDDFSYGASMKMVWVCISVFTVCVGVFSYGGVIMLASSAPLGLIRYVFAPLFLGMACIGGWLTVRTCVGVASGLPRLTATSSGVRLVTVLGDETWAEWNSLTTFAEKHVAGGHGGQSGAVAKIVGPNISGNLNGRSEFVIRASVLLRNTIPNLVQEINARHPVRD
jgi:hypothetical protein